MEVNPRRSRRRSGALAALAALLAGVGGCGTTKMTGTPSTGTEQLLLTNAWDDAVRKIDFRPLAGVPVYFDSQNMTAVDQGYVVSSIRQAMLLQGVLLRPKPEQAQWIVEGRVGAYGTDDYNLMIGIPQVTVPPTITGVPNGTIPKMPLAEKSQQWALAKLALFAYDRASGRIVWSSGTTLATADAKDVYVLGSGPWQSGSIRKRNKRIGVNMPLLSDPAPEAADRSPGFAPPPPGSGPKMSLPASAADLEQFAP